MRVVFNALSTFRPKTGIGHYADQLLRALQLQMPAGMLQAFPSGRLATSLSKSQRPKVGVPATRRGFATMMSRVKSLGVEAAKIAARAAIELAFRRECRRGGFHLYHEPNFIPFSVDIPTVTTVADLSVLQHPEWHPAERVRLYDRHFAAGLSASKHILTISEFVRRQIINDLGISPERVTAVHLGISGEYGRATPQEICAVRSRYNLPANYLLFVGTVEPRKNLATLLRAYCDLQPSLRQRCPLVLAGAWGWRSEDVAALFRSDAAAKGVVHLGYTPDNLLPPLYAGARALVFPSHYEGFGLPPLEMLACGGCVISSTADALREVLGTHAEYVDAQDVTGWRNALTRAIADDDWLMQARRGGRNHAARFSWSNCAAETIAVYRRVVAGQHLAAA